MSKFREHVKNISMVSTLLGGYFFFSYVVSERIPFPMEMDSLLSLLVVVGSLSALFSIVGAMYVVMAVFVTDDLYGKYYYKYFYQSSNIIPNKYVSSIVGFVIYFLLAPTSFWVSSFLDYSLWLPLVLFLAIPFLYSFYLLTPDKKLLPLDFAQVSTQQYVLLVFSFFFINILSNMSFVLYVQFLSFTELVVDDPEFYLSCVIFVFFSYISLIPVKPKTEFEQTASKYRKNTPILNFIKRPAALVYLLAVMFCLYPPVTSKIASRVLYLLGVGGSLERSYHYTPNARVQVPPVLVNECVASYCETKPVIVLLDVGGTLFVRLAGDDSAPIIALAGKSMYPIIPQKDT